MRSPARLVVLGALVVSLVPVVTSAATAEIVSVLPCSPTSVHVTEYNTLVGAGNVNDLYWIRNDSNSRCSLRGYVHVRYLGHYGANTTGGATMALSVDQVDTPSGGSNGNDIGGIHKGAATSTVVLAPHGLASFWIYGHDESTHLTGGKSTRCITSFKMLVRLPGSVTPVEVLPIKSNGFFWCGSTAVHPIVSGNSGSMPSEPLTKYFG
jgi:hypothetical protein